MRILILPGTYDMLNLGDLAMLEVCLERLRALWPEAHLDVLTNEPAALLKCCPGVHPVRLKGRNRWLKLGSLPSALFPGLPAERRKYLPVTRSNWWRLALLAWPGQYCMVRGYVEAFFHADLFVMSGCGVISDAFHYNGERILRMFGTALLCGIPSVMTSQGIGPLRHPALALRAREVLPRLPALFIREPLHTKNWLQQAGVPSQRVTLTGDDAIAIAHQSRATQLGNALGVNLRLAAYSSLGETTVEALKSVILQANRKWACPVVGLPILTGQAPHGDVQTLSRLLPDPVGLESARKVRTPGDLARETSRCRVVITGSYHAGVFALSQGIPAVCLAGSDYYHEKFTGLAALFGAGCTVLRTEDPDLEARLWAALAESCEQALGIREALLKRAGELITGAEAAYGRLREILRQRPPG